VVRTSSTPVPPPVRRPQSVAVNLVAHLERLIASGELPPGSRLPGERELASSLSVSRASLREAMHELEQKHLVERTPGRGTIVAEPSDQERALRALPPLDAEPPDAEQDYAAELRGILEPTIAALAAERATAADVVQLQDVLLTSAGDLRPARSLELDLEFHRVLARASHNPLLTALHERMSDWTMPVRERSHRRKSGRQHSVEGHRDICAAVAAHDAEAARAAMTAHLADVHHLIARQAGQ